ncbi:glycosyltransferase family 2 protein [Lachnospiraceae bacterium NSJ-143]|nr:glycosyltransferase family 2 protein [Lachnospiraceae bacterium NSJ-143]
MKKVSIMIPCYNEQDNVHQIFNAVRDLFQKNLPEYDFEVVFIDNKSTDNTRKLLRELCLKDNHAKAIFNMKNFGQNNSPYYGLCQTTGDCAILLCADFQDPIELIPTMVNKWEEGNRVVCMVKTSSKENKIMYLFRSIYYKTLKSMSDIQQIEHFTGFGLYDRSFIDIMREMNDSTPFLRGMVAEFAPDHVEIEYEQQKRRAGKTSNNFFSLFDIAMLSFTSYTKGGLRMATFGGFFVGGFSFIVAIFYFIFKLTHWDTFTAGNAPILIGVFFLGGLQLFFTGLLGEYIMSMNTRIMNRPLVIEEERINFE